MRNIITNSLNISKLKFIWNLFVFYRNLQETKIYTKKGKYSLSLAHLLNISLFFMCFNSCGKASAQVLDNHNSTYQAPASLQIEKRQADCLFLDWSTACKDMKNKK